jgi:uncharacterized membrane protein YbaN (DUF454 family)
VTPERAKSILAIYRGRPEEKADPEILEALKLAESDPELKKWLDAHLAFHGAVKAKLRQAHVPSHLKESLLASRRIVRPQVWWRRPAGALAMAASIVLLGVLAILLFKPEPAHDRFAQYETRMIGTALRQYRMDVLSSDMGKVRQFMESQGAPADYEITPGLERLKLTGGGALKWRGNPVAMVCFDRGDQQMLYLFVTKAAAIKDPPPAEPQAKQVSDLLAVSWTEGDKTYLLAGPAEAGFERKYVQ